MFGIKHLKSIENTIKYKEKISSVQKIHIEMCKERYCQVSLVLAGFASNKLVLNYIKQAWCNLISTRI